MTNGTLLVTKAKRIYKPRWSEHALSVRRQLKSKYPDSPVEYRADGTWRFFYFQENLSLEDGDAEFTNWGMISAMNLGVPIGVLQQISGKPSSRYKVLGLAVVAGYDSGFFVLEGFSEEGFAHNNKIRSTYAAQTKAHEVREYPESIPSPKHPVGRRMAMRLAVVRQGQPKFRSELLRAYGGCCAVTGCDVPEALEAAHIDPYEGPMSNTLSNGVLLRSDVHSLFDLGLLGINPDNNTVVVAPEIKMTATGNIRAQRSWCQRRPKTGRIVRN